jgi:hypothetical protein
MPLQGLRNIYSATEPLLASRSRLYPKKQQSTVAGSRMSFEKKAYFTGVF